MELNENNTTPVAEFRFGTPSGVMFELTCKNHLDLRWSTKNPFVRNLHFIGLAKDPHDITTRECDCPFEDLVVIEPYRRVVFSDGSHYDTNNKDEIEDFKNALVNETDMADEGSPAVLVTAVILL
jgi:hypothetical protein